MPPLSPAIVSELGLNQTVLGLLTTIPVLMLSLAALPGSAVIARIGPLKTLVLAMVIITFASMLRTVAPPVSMMLAATVLLGFAISIMQPAFPALVIRWCPGFIALGSAIYMNGMLMGEFIGGGLTLSIVMPLLDDNWRSAVIAWSAPALLVARILLLSTRLGLPAVGAIDMPATSGVSVFGQARVWRFGVVLGAASAGFFGANAYMQTLLENAAAATELSWYLFVFNGTQVIGSLVMIFLAQHLIGKRFPIIAMAWCIFLSLAGAATTTGSLLIASIVLLGFSTCVQLILVVGLVPQVSSAEEAPSLAAGMFAVGYFLAFVIPLLSGLIVDATGATAWILAPLILLAMIAGLMSHQHSSETSAVS